MLSKEKKYIITIVICIVTSTIVFIMLRNNNHSILHSVLISLIPFIIIGLMGLKWVSIKKENFDNEQTINIIQNCGNAPQPSPQPTPPQPGPISKDMLEKWVNSVDPQLTSTCKNCIIESALKMWSSQTLSQVQAMPIDKQKTILNALLAFDCNKQCVIPPSGLNPAAIDQWLRVLNPNLSANCHHCVVDIILKQWTEAAFKIVLENSKSDQLKIVESLLALNCPNCDLPNKLKEADVQKWVGGLLSGAKPNCYACIVDMIVKMWSTTDLARIKNMDKKSQLNVLQALLALSCNKECVEVPSGLTPQEVSNWLSTVLTGENINCQKCLVSSIVKLWSPAVFQSIKVKSKIEQDKILQGIIAMNCKNSCLVGNLQKEQVENWVQRILPNANVGCSACIVEQVLRSYDKDTFHNLLLQPSADQNKVANLISNFNCPHVCNLTPTQEADYLLY